jgi:hypothetical protein
LIFSGVGAVARRAANGLGSKGSALRMMMNIATGSAATEDDRELRRESVLKQNAHDHEA